MTLGEALSRAAKSLVQAGILAGGADAERLLGHVLSQSGFGPDLPLDVALSEEVRGRFEALVKERARRRPIQHLLGTQGFRKQEYRVTPDVFIPRPTTEQLVDVALELLEGSRSPLVVDVGTGCGCIALSLAIERPGARIHACDLSPAALAVARENARRLVSFASVEFHEGDLLGPVASLFGEIDLILCNPPYVDPREKGRLPPEVEDHEPHLALFCPTGPYGTYESLAPQAALALRPGGFLAMEMGPGMGPRLRAVFEEAGLSQVSARHDVFGAERIVLGRRPTTS